MCIMYGIYVFKTLVIGSSANSKLKSRQLLSLLFCNRHGRRIYDELDNQEFYKMWITGCHRMFIRQPRCL